MANFLHLFASLTPQVGFFYELPFFRLFFQYVSMASIMTWSASGYINTDIQYNLSDLSEVQVTVMPSLFPIGQTVRTQDGERTRLSIIPARQ